MEDSLPNPYYTIEMEGQSIKYSRYGCLIDDQESLMLVNGNFFQANSYLDIFYSNPDNRSRDYMHPMKYLFYIDKKSYISNLDEEVDHI